MRRMNRRIPPSPRSNRAPPKTHHQVREDLNVYRLKQSHDAKVREDLNRYRLKQDGQDYQDGQDESGLGAAQDSGCKGSPSLGPLGPKCL